MPDVHEVFRLVTQEVRPDPGALDRQSRRQRRRNNRRKAGVYALVAAMTVGTVVVAAGAAAHRSDLGSAQTPTPHVGAASLVPTVVGTDGIIRRTFGFLPSDAWNVTVSPDGTQIVYVTGSIDVGNCGACTPGPRLVVVRTDGTGSHYVTLHTATSPALVEMPAWSPDGRKIAFAGVSNGFEEIYVVGADGSHPRRLTASSTQNEYPAWSPDGTTIYYDSSGRTPPDDAGLSPTQEIWSIPATGGTPTRLTRNDVPDQAPTVAPDGTIAFVHDGAIVEMNADGGDPRRIPGAPQGWSPRFSPDGSTIAVLNIGLTVVVIDARTGIGDDLGVQVASTREPVSWMPSGDAVLVGRPSG